MTQHHDHKLPSTRRSSPKSPQEPPEVRTGSKELEGIRVSEERFQQFFETLPAYCYMISPSGNILDVNSAACKALGYRKEELVGRPVSAIYAPESLSKMGDLFEKWKRRGLLQGEELVVETKQGQKRTVLLSARSVKDGKGNLLHSTSVQVDITDRKRAREALSAVSRRLIEAQEQERARIARELHDDIGQRLALLALAQDRLQHDHPDLPDKVRSCMGELWKQTCEIATDLQSLSHELHSARLEVLGMAVAMRGFCKEFAEEQKVEIDLQIRDLPSPLPSDISLCLFRVLQEALHNSAKHSGARRYEVRLWGTSEELQLSVADSGKGFDTEAAKKGEGLGLVSMQERLKILNGTFAVLSQPNQGTTIHARVPLNKVAQASA